MCPYVMIWYKTALEIKIYIFLNAVNKECYNFIMIYILLGPTNEIYINGMLPVGIGPTGMIKH